MSREKVVEDAYNALEPKAVESLENIKRTFSSGARTARHLKFSDQLEQALKIQYPSLKIPEGGGPAYIVSLFLRTVLDGDIPDNERAHLLSSIFKYMYPTLKAVEHSGEVSQVNIQLTHKEIQSILQSDPFLAAKEVKDDSTK